mgnify:CR=1 FL=1
MKILINSQSLRPPLTGIGNYTLHLLQALQQQPEIEQLDCFNGRNIISLSALLNQQRAEEKTSRGEGQAWQQTLRESIRALPFAYKLRSVWLDYQFEKLAKQGQYTIYHEPNFILKKYSGPCVTTVHDLSFIHYPQYHPAERVSWLSKELPKTLARADAVITDSDFIRDELLGRYNLDEQKVTRVHLGVDSRFKPYTPIQTADFLNSLGLQHGRYVLFVGTLEPRKGIDVLLDAWQQQPHHLRSSFTLVLAGAPGWCNETLLKRIALMQSEGSLRLLKFVDASNLPLLYAGAALFAYPSVYEGFGLPVLEAMASGVKVICARHSAMAEFALEGACLNDSSSCDELANVLQRELERRIACPSTGNFATKHAQSFTWQTCAKQTLAVYQKLQ